MAQTITPDKTWHLESGMSCPEGAGTRCFCFLGTSTVKVGGTKTFGGKEYYELLSDNTVNQWNVVNYVREDGDKVFSYSERCNEELLMYDFGLEAGDTIYFANQGNPTCAPTESYTVTNVDSIGYNQGKRKQLKLSHTFYSNSHSVWVQGIGSMRGINFVPGPGAVGGLTMLKSVYQSDNLIFENENPEFCWVEPTHVNLSSSANRLSGAIGFVGVHQGRIALNLRSGVYVADLLDLQGRLVRRAPFSASDGQTLTSLSVTGLSSGMYLLRVKQGSLSVISSQVIVK